MKKVKSYTNIVNDMVTEYKETCICGKEFTLTHNETLDSWNNKFNNGTTYYCSGVCKRANEGKDDKGRQYNLSGYTAGKRSIKHHQNRKVNLTWNVDKQAYTNS